MHEPDFGAVRRLFRRPLPVVIGGMLEGVADLEDGDVVVHAADDLQAYRQSVGKAHRDDERRVVRCVE